MLDAQRIEDRDDVLVAGVRHGLGHRPSVAALVEPDDPVPRGDKPGDAVIPGSQLGDAGMDEDDGWIAALARIDDMEATTGDGDGAFGHRATVATSRDIVSRWPSRFGPGP